MGSVLSQRPFHRDSDGWSGRAPGARHFLAALTAGTENPKAASPHESQYTLPPGSLHCVNAFPSPRFGYEIMLLILAKYNHTVKSKIFK